EAAGGSAAAGASGRLRRFRVLGRLRALPRRHLRRRRRMERDARCRPRQVARLGLARSPIPERSPLILAIDIGGTKFSMAVFDAAGVMVRRESRATDDAGGRE